MAASHPQPPSRPVPKEYLHSAELRDIMQFGSSSQAVFFKMRVAGVLHIFQFETRQVCAVNASRFMCVVAACGIRRT